MLSDQPTGNDYYNYDSWWNWIYLNFTSMIFADDRERHKIPKSAVVKLLKSALQAYNSDNIAGAVHLAQLVDLIKELDWLRNRSKSQFTHFKSIFSSGIARQQSNLSGFWFELRITCMLLRANYSFTKPDPPDFMISHESTFIAIECYAPRIKSINSLYPKFKKTLISNKVKKYKSQQWLSQRKCLFIDGTSIIRLMGQTISHEAFVLPPDLNKCLVEFYQIQFYDLILFMWFGHVTQSNEDASTVNCVWLPHQIEDEFLLTFKNTFLNDFKEEKGIKTILPDLADD